MGLGPCLCPSLRAEASPCCHLEVAWGTSFLTQEAGWGLYNTCLSSFLALLSPRACLGEWGLPASLPALTHLPALHRTAGFAILGNLDRETGDWRQAFESGAEVVSSLTPLFLSPPHLGTGLPVGCPGWLDLKVGLSLGLVAGPAHSPTQPVCARAQVLLQESPGAGAPRAAKRPPLLQFMLA